MTPSEKILKIRCELNMSQEALARELGVSFATINRWEKGHTIPSIRYLYLIDRFCEKKNIVINNY